jgi:hypothetical protein
MMEKIEAKCVTKLYNVGNKNKKKNGKKEQAMHEETS